MKDYVIVNPNLPISRVRELLGKEFKYFSIAYIIKYKRFDLIKLKEFIKTNSIQCKRCKTIIESIYPHHIVYCKCGRCAVDGGFEKLIRKGVKGKDYKELSIIIPLTPR